MTQVLQYFDRHARRFDHVYDVSGPAARLRAGPAHGRALAAAVVAGSRHPAVLDVGCGPGRVGEAVLDDGASEYVGIDVSPQMLALARRRLRRFDCVELIEGDFRRVALPRRFEVVLALGLFEYLDEPAAAAAWLRAHCSEVLVASFTRWELLKGPARHLHYALHGCRITDYSEAEAEALLTSGGFSGVEFPHQGARGFTACARVADRR